jgi:succinate dehydrogenase/fumarate reductase flavoprotein subunit
MLRLRTAGGKRRRSESESVVEGSVQRERMHEAFGPVHARSLLECCVFGRRAGKAAAEKART